MKIYALSLAIMWLIVNGAIAADAGYAPSACNEVQTCGSPDCCAHCGCHGCCEKYCRVVCEMKEVKKTVWAVKCEDFCAPLPSCPLQCGENCEPCCKEGCNKCCNPCASLENRNYIPPKCGKVRTKKTLEKKEVVCKIPSYKCVVVYVCSNCGSECGGESEHQGSPTPADAPVPPKITQSVPMPVVGESFMK